jgi:hypothetical protein
MKMTREETGQLAEFCDRVLRIVAARHPDVARELPTWLDRRGESDLKGLDRQVAKAQVLRKKNPRLFEAIRSMSREPKLAIYLSLFQKYPMKSLNPFGEHTGGNYKNL